MIDFIYLERNARDFPLARDILRRFPRATVVECERYTEIFNRKAQNFRLQKSRPALILALKNAQWVLPAPAQYSIGGARNFYFSHVLNCLYDCRYCFLQGMYRSAHYVLFVNYADFLHELDRLCQASAAPPTFFSGYDGDSLALEPVSRFAEHFLPFFAQHPRALLELRTKSTQIRVLRAMDALPNCVVAFSFTPESISRRFENKVPAQMKRIHAAHELQQRGWPVGLRFDPLIFPPDASESEFQHCYRELFQALAANLDMASLHSVSLGGFRMPQAFFKTAQSLYPHEALWAAVTAKKDGLVCYPVELEQRMLAFCRHELLNYLPEDKLFIYA